jgi:hypothetical protein
MIKACKDCGYTVGKDKATGKWWCSKCKEVKTEFSEKYRIAVFGKNTGKNIGLNNFAKCLAREWKLLGHEVIEVHPDIIYEAMRPYETEDCHRFKKPINLKLLQYRHDPDFIFIEQMYERFDTSEITCPVIYQHREYTHFPDVYEPDMLLASYPNRIQIYELYNPWGYHNCKFRADNFVAVYPPFFPPNEKKTIEGISYMGWGAPAQHFINANGPIARMVIEDQVGFWEECRKYGMTFIKGQGGKEHYKERLGSMEAVVIDGGYINGFGRTLWEAIVMKTLCVCRIHNDQIARYYKKIGIDESMVYFIHEPSDIAVLLEDWDSEEKVKERAEMVEKAYNFVLENHTYETRARETLDMFEEFKGGGTRMPRFMGYAKRVNMELKDGVLEIQTA